MEYPESSPNVKVGSNYLVLRLERSLDAQTVIVAEKERDRNLGAEQRYLIIDMSECAFVSSIGIRFLVVTGKQLRDAGGEMFLAGLRKSVRDVLAICGLGKVFPIHDSVDLAIASLA